MDARTVVDPRNARALLTTHLCPACVRRVLETAPNPRYVVPPTREVPTAEQLRRRHYEGRADWRARLLSESNERHQP